MTTACSLTLLTSFFTLSIGIRVDLGFQNYCACVVEQRKGALFFIIFNFIAKNLAPKLWGTSWASQQFIYRLFLGDLHAKTGVFEQNICDSSKFLGFCRFSHHHRAEHIHWKRYPTGISKIPANLSIKLTKKRRTRKTTRLMHRTAKWTKRRPIWPLM